MTEIHRQAADIRHSVWLSAHAGSGKTKTLVDRVLRLLLAGHAPSSILCLTYTRAAAMEMQVRIRARLSGWVAMDDKTLKADLSDLVSQDVTTSLMHSARTLLCRLLEDSEGLRIQTIHAFCQSLLMRFPVEAELAPGFQVAEDRQKRELLEETRQLLFGHALDARRWPDLVNTLEIIARQVGDKIFVDLTHALVNEHVLLFSLLSRPEGLLQLHRGIFAGLDCPPDATTATVLAEFVESDRSNQDALKHAADLLRTSGKNDNALATRISAWLSGTGSEAEFSDYCNAYLTTTGAARAAVCTKGFAEKHPAIAELLNDQQFRVIDTTERLRAIKTAHFSAALMTMANGLLTLYNQEKERRGLLDYDDLILHALQLLSRPGMCEWVLSRLGRDIAHVLIDEAQDTSASQWALTQLLVQELFTPEQYEQSPRTLFVVGDAKQSIYRFQGAEPEAFTAMRSEYRNWFIGSGQPFHELALTRSFRSSAAVLSLVDSFCSLPGVPAAIGEADVCHAVDRVGVAGCVTLWPLIGTEKEPIPPPWDVEIPMDASAESSGQLAKQIAATIADWLSEQRMLESHARPVRPGDIMILLRRRAQLMQPLIRELRQAGVPVAGADRLRLLEHLAVKDVLALADWCLLPSDDLSLACVLKGPWFGWTEDQLFGIAHNRDESSLWQSLVKSQPNGTDTERLETIRRQSLMLAPYEWLSFLFDKLQGRKLLKSQFGNEADELCDELLSQALLFENVHPDSLQYFVHWLRAGEGDIKREAEHAGNAVRVMTIHGAKGLQAPIVMLPDTMQKPRLDEKLWWDRVNGQTVCYVVPSGESPPRRVMEAKDVLRQENEAEYLRQLYVALTRAENELHIFGASDNGKTQPGCWYDFIQRAFDQMEGVTASEHATGTIYQLVCPQTKKVNNNEKTEEYSDYPDVPHWLVSPAIKHPEPPIAATPEPASHATARGTLTHALLQWLPPHGAGVSRESLLQFTQQMAGPQPALPIDEIVEEVWQIYQDEALKWIFAANSRTEIPVLSSHAILRRLDRLVIEKNHITIVDFKTDREVPIDETGIPAPYLAQMDNYRRLIAPAFPRHEIKVAILWTATRRLMLLHTAFLNDTTARLDSGAA